MARGSFGRTVARAASSGGSKSYRARRPMAWYFLMTVIVVVGVGLIVYSRNEALRVPAVMPTAKTNWYAALADRHLRQDRAEAAGERRTSPRPVGLRHVGDGLINARPALAGAGAAAYEGKKATLGLFAKELQLLRVEAHDPTSCTTRARASGHGQTVTAAPGPTRARGRSSPRCGPHRRR